MKTLALELVPVRVHAVTPGLMETPRLHTADGAERDTLVQNWAAVLSKKRMSTAEEVAQVILVLIPYDDLTGEVVHVDGGERFVSHGSSDCAYYDGGSVPGARVARVHTPGSRRGADWPSGSWHARLAASKIRGCTLTRRQREGSPVTRRALYRQPGGSEGVLRR